MILSRSRTRAGFIVISELLLIVSILVIGLLIGLVTLRNTFNSELEDVAQNIGDLNQSYAFSGVVNDNGSAVFAGSAFFDASASVADDWGTWQFTPATAGE
jgi:hypothetical protein